MNDDQSPIRAIDSLSANEFAVELEGEVMTGVFGVSGLCSLALDGRVPVHHPLVISKMVQREADLPANRWVRETLANPPARVTRTLAIVALDEGVETRRWVLRDAWISQIAYSDFDSASQALVEERLTIEHGGVEVVWPGG
ncbi:MAG: phage tail protein [Chloroflexota bacterium]|nr:phage tail protein [Anaerolineae bacterium]HMM27516.1 phage tail protein [Aggregatilineaceae bacterium]